MKIEQKIEIRIQDLLNEATWLAQSDSSGAAFSDEQCAECFAWLVSAQHIIQTICSEINTPYLNRANSIAEEEHGWRINQGVRKMAAILKHLLADINAGLLSSISNNVRAETFDDFLEHAEKYHSENKKNESGAIAGVVFEDTIRRICKKFEIQESGIKLDSLISELSSRGKISSAKAKRARAAAHVRTKATHAQWDEFELTDVKATIEFTREIISEKLAG